MASTWKEVLLRKYLKTIHLILCYIRQSNKFHFKILLARGFGFCIIAFMCNYPFITPVILCKGGWHFCFVFGCGGPSYLLSDLTESFNASFSLFVFCFFGGFFSHFFVNFLLREASTDYSRVSPAPALWLGAGLQYFSGLFIEICYHWWP